MPGDENKSTVDLTPSGPSWSSASPESRIPSENFIVSTRIPASCVATATTSLRLIELVECEEVKKNVYRHYLSRP